MAQTITRGQISFIDLNDGRSMNLVLLANKALTQLYDKDLHSYSPDYSVSPYLVISPTLYISGLTGNQISGISTTPTWTINGTAASSFGNDVIIGTTNPYTLTIKKNKLVNDDQMTIVCTVNYVDPASGLSTPITAQITFQLLETVAELIRAIAYAQDTPIFYNDHGGSSTISLHCDMWRGSSIDDTNVSYQWFRKDDPDGPDAYDWHKIVASFSGSGSSPATGQFPDGQTWCEVLKDGITGYDTNTLTVTAADVLNYDSFMCMCTDTDSSSTTYTNVVRSETVSILDWTDPYTLDFVTPSGTTLTAGTTSVQTTVTVWQNGESLDPSKQNLFYYLWTKANNAGRLATGVDTTDPDDYKASDNSAPPTPDSSWSSQTIGSRTLYCRYTKGGSASDDSARKITVYKNEIKVKNTFFCEVIIP